LYLDESKFVEKQTQSHLFALAGIIVPDSEKEEIGRAVIDVKRCVWPSADEYNSVVLHEADIRSNNPSVLSKQILYAAVLNKRANEASIIRGIGEIINTFDLAILGAIVDQTSVEQAFNIEMERNVYASYKLAFARLIENFMVFLKQNDGVGEIVLESRRTGSHDVEDERVKKIYCKILAHGTLIYNGVELQKRLTGLSFISKFDNNQLLQIADFIPRPILLAYAKTPQTKPSIYQTSIRKNRFSAGQRNGSSKFGVSIIR
jgi:hypothetical protein